MFFEHIIENFLSHKKMCGHRNFYSGFLYQPHFLSGNNGLRAVIYFQRTQQCINM